MSHGSKSLGKSTGILAIAALTLIASVIPEVAVAERVRTRAETRVKPAAPEIRFHYRFRAPLVETQQGREKLNSYRSAETITKELIRDRSYQQDTFQFLSFFRQESNSSTEFNTREGRIRSLLEQVEAAAARGDTKAVAERIRAIEDLKVEILKQAKDRDGKLFGEKLLGDGEFYISGDPKLAASGGQRTGSLTEVATRAETHGETSQIAGENSGRATETGGRMDKVLLARSAETAKTELAGLGEVREGKTVRDALKDMDVDALAENLVENHAFMTNLSNAFRNLGILNGQGDVQSQMREVLRAVLRNRSDFPLAHLMAFLKRYETGDTATKESITESLKGMGRLASLDRKLHDAAANKNEADLIAHIEKIIAHLKKTNPAAAAQLEAELNAAKGNKDAVSKLWVTQLTREYVSYGNEFRDMIDKDGTKGETFKSWLSGDLVGKYEAKEKNIWESLQKNHCWV